LLHELNAACRVFASLGHIVRVVSSTGKKYCSWNCSNSRKALLQYLLKQYFLILYCNNIALFLQRSGVHLNLCHGSCWAAVSKTTNLSC